MKAAIEYSLMFLIGTFIITVILQFTAVVANIHQAHLYLNYMTHITNNYDGDVDDIKNHERQQTICKSCTYTHTQFNDRLEIEVMMPVRVPVLSYNSQMRIKGISQPFE